MRQAAAEVSPVKSIGALRNVHLLALGTKDLDSILTKLVVEAIWHDSLLVTVGARAEPVCALQVLSVDQGQT